MSNIIKHVVKENISDVKLKDYMKEYLNVSTRFCRSSSKENNIRVNGNIAKLSKLIKLGDTIEIKINKTESQDIEPEYILLDIAYEDEDILVINKKPGMVVHPTKSYQSGTLSNGVMYHFQSKKENCIVRLVNRLDRDTSGLIIIAKNQFSHMSLARDMSSEKFVKSYLAVIHGHLVEDEGTIDLPIYKPEGDGIKRIVDKLGQRSITHFNIIDKFKNAELVKLTLETGRTHQIRVHLSYLGNPIYGDSLYGKLEPESIERQALHAFSLSFPHPRDGRIIQIKCDIPKDMNDLINRLKNE